VAIELRVNGEVRTVDVDGSTPLLYVLRNDLGLSGPRFGCGVSQCGACTVLVDGRPLRSCVRPVAQMVGREITTLAGLGTPAAPHPLQTAFLEHQAMQCGFCVSGILMTAAALLDDTPKPSDAQIRSALDGHLCRCGAHDRMLRAIRSVAAAHDEGGEA
jgi:nicotinate dehydrogenase subunit A